MAAAKVIPPQLMYRQALILTIGDSDDSDAAPYTVEDGWVVKEEPAQVLPLVSSRGVVRGSRECICQAGATHYRGCWVASINCHGAH